VSVVEVVVELKAYPDDGIGNFVSSTPGFKESLAKLSAHFQRWSDL